MRPQFDVPRPRGEANKLPKKPAAESIEELGDSDFQQVSSSGMENLVVEFDAAEWKEPKKEEAPKKKEPKLRRPSVPAERRRADAAEWAQGRHMPKDPGLLPEEDRKRQPLPPYVPAQSPRSTSGLLEQERAALSRRHAEMEAREHVQIDSPPIELTEEEMNAPTQRPSELSSAPMSDRPSAPEHSEVRMRKPEVIRVEASGGKKFREVERLSPDSFVGHGTVKRTHLTASAAPSVFEGVMTLKDYIVNALTGNGRDKKEPRSGKRKAA